MIHTLIFRENNAFIIITCTFFYAVTQILKKLDTSWKPVMFTHIINIISTLLNILS